MKSILRAPGSPQPKLEWLRRLPLAEQLNQGAAQRSWSEPEVLTSNEIVSIVELNNSTGELIKASRLKVLKLNRDLHGAKLGCRALQARTAPSVLSPDNSDEDEVSPTNMIDDSGQPINGQTNDNEPAANSVLKNAKPQRREAWLELDLNCKYNGINGARQSAEV